MIRLTIHDLLEESPAYQGINDIQTHLAFLHEDHFPFQLIRLLEFLKHPFDSLRWWRDRHRSMICPACGKARMVRNAALDHPLGVFDDGYWEVYQCGKCGETYEEPID